MRGAAQAGQGGVRGVGQGGQGGGQGRGGAGRGRRGGGNVEGFSQSAGPSRGGRGAELAGRGRGSGAVGQAGGPRVVQGGGGGGGGDGAGNQAVGRGGRGRGGERASKGRTAAWVFTINHCVGAPTADFLRGPGHPLIKYLCYGRKVSENGTTHLQGYVSFVYGAKCNPSKYFQQFGNAHVEVARGNADANAEFCAKDGVFYEFGVRPKYVLLAEKESRTLGCPYKGCIKVASLLSSSRHSSKIYLDLDSIQIFVITN